MKNNIQTVFKSLFIIAGSMLFCFCGHAQDISFKDHIVTIDSKECLKVAGDPNNVVFSTMNDEEVIILKFIRATGNLYTKVIFVNEKKSLTSRTYIFNKKNLIKNLVQTKALEDCKLVEKKLEIFILKYDERIEN